MVTVGGEVAFVKRMIAESVALKERVQWYTSMLGKLSSVSTIIGLLKEAAIQNWAVTEFVQGTKTRRWAVAWSWGDLRPRMASASDTGNKDRLVPSLTPGRTWQGESQPFPSTSYHSRPSSHSPFTQPRSIS